MGSLHLSHHMHCRWASDIQATSTSCIVSACRPERSVVSNLVTFSGDREKVSDEDVAEAAHYVKYSFAAYGYLLYVFSKPIYSCALPPPAVDCDGVRCSAASSSRRFSRCGIGATLLDRHCNGFRPRHISELHHARFKRALT